MKAPIALAGLVAGAALLAAPAAADLPFEGQTLTVLNWNGYGSDTELALRGFEERTGATVRHVYHSGGEEMRQILRMGGIGQIDVIAPNGSFLLQLVDEGMVAPIDTARISTLDEISPDFLMSPDISRDGVLYGVPWVWGSTGLTYSTEAFAEPPTSWAVLWDEANRGNVGVMDSPVEAIMLAALHLGLDPHDPDLGQVRDALRELHRNVQLYWSSGDDWDRAFLTGAVTVGNYWSGNAGTLMAQGEPAGYVIPEEGAVGWMDTWSIVADAPNPELAHAWIDWMTGAEFLTAWAEDPAGAAPAPANAIAASMLSEAARARTQSYPEVVERLAIMQNLSPERQQVWTDLWAEVKSGL